MRHAPSVNAPVGRFSWGVPLAALAWTLGAGTLVAWACVTPPGPRHALVALVLLGCAVAAYLDSRRGGAGRLAWDGAQWQWEAGGQAQVVCPEVCLDLQSVMLVRLRPLAARTAPAHWRWFSARQDRANWQDLRRALHGSPTSQVSPNVPDSWP